jgi:hypothetical protein
MASRALRAPCPAGPRTTVAGSRSRSSGVIRCASGRSAGSGAAGGASGLSVAAVWPRARMASASSCAPTMVATSATVVPAASAGAGVSGWKDSK